MTFPKFSLTTTGAVEVSVLYYLDEDDASMWQTPINLNLEGREKTGGIWEADVCLTREQAAMLRDALTLLLRVPDRLERRGEANNEHQP